MVLSIQERTIVFELTQAAANGFKQELHKFSGKTKFIIDTLEIIPDDPSQFSAIGDHLWLVISTASEASITNDTLKKESTVHFGMYHDDWGLKPVDRSKQVVVDQTLYVSIDTNGLAAALNVTVRLKIRKL